MAITPFTELACPLDGDPLHAKGASWRCPNGHSFDVAREGYINLLPVQRKRSRDPGDSKAMVAARRRFLGRGFYQPIADAVCNTVLAGPAPEGDLRCLDAGCGEGYQLRALAAAAGAHRALALAGLDISKWAVQAAARQARPITWLVGSNAGLPVQSASLDWLLCLFGFPAYGEFARVLKPGGRLLMVDPGADHLRELREILYPSLRPPRDRERPPPSGFVLEATSTLRYPIHLDRPEDIADLLTMTPHLYRASAAGRARAEALADLALTVDTGLRCLVRQP